MNMKIMQCPHCDDEVEVPETTRRKYCINDGYLMKAIKDD